jgi:hypothetical protein
MVAREQWEDTPTGPKLSDEEEEEEGESNSTSPVSVARDFPPI